VDTIGVAVVIQPCENLTFNFLTAEELKKLAVLGWLPGTPGLIAKGIYDSKKTKEISDDSKVFLATIGQYDHIAVFDSVLAIELSRFSPYFKMVPVPLQMGQALTNTDRPDLAQLKGRGCQCLLRIREKQAGMTTLIADKVQAFSEVLFDLFDLESGKQVERYSQNLYEKEPALTKRDVFTNAYPFAAKAVAAAMLGLMNNKDILYSVAERNGLGKKVPTVASLLKENLAKENRISFTLKSPRGWDELKTIRNTAVIFPKKDNSAVLCMLSVVLLDTLENVSTVDDYRRVWLNSQEAAWLATETMEPFSDLTLPSGWKAFTVASKDKQGKVIEIMHMENGVEFNLQFHFFKQYDEYFREYRGALQEIINGSKFEGKPK
jgi:hypothetical protein